MTGQYLGWLLAASMAVPEIDGASSAGPIALMLGGWMVWRGSRRRGMGG